MQRHTRHEDGDIMEVEIGPSRSLKETSVEEIHINADPSERMDTSDAQKSPAVAPITTVPHSAPRPGSPTRIDAHIPPATSARRNSTPKGSRASNAEPTSRSTNSTNGTDELEVKERVEYPEGVARADRMDWEAAQAIGSFNVDQPGEEGQQDQGSGEEDEEGDDESGASSDEEGEGEAEKEGNLGDESRLQIDADITFENAEAVEREQKERVGAEPEPDEDDDKATTDGSDDEDRPKPRKEMPTIRLTIDLSRSTYELTEKSVVLLAREAGYDLPEDTAITHGVATLPTAEAPPTPPPEGHTDPNAPKARKKRKRRILERDEGYDVEDPFVDDSEAQVTEPKFYYAPERDGFYVAEGMLELKQGKRSRGRKPGSKNKARQENAAPLPFVAADGQPTIVSNGYVPEPTISGTIVSGTTISGTTVSGTRLAPITLDEEDANAAANASITSFASHSAANLLGASGQNGVTGRKDQLQVPDKDAMRALLKQSKRRWKGTPMSAELEQVILDLKVEVDKATPFPPKKFPPHLKPLTIAVAQKAIDLGEYDDCFFVRIADIFPYNTFTIKKLIKKDILEQRKTYYNEQIDLRLKQLQSLIDEAAPAAVADYERSLVDYSAAKSGWETRQAVKGVPTDGPPRTGPTVGGDEEQDPARILDGDAPPKEPPRNFKLGPRMKEIYWEILKLDDELTEVIKDTQKIVEKEVTHTELFARKALYARIVQMFPDGFMTSHKLSREMTVLKKKFENV